LAAESVTLGTGEGRVATLTGLGEGLYVVTAKLQLDVGDVSPGTTVTCDLEAGMDTDESAVLFDNPNNTGVATLPLMVAAEVPMGGGAAILACSGPPMMIVRNIKLVAIQIDTLIRVMP